MVANVNVEKAEEVALTYVPLKSMCMFRYVNDTFVIWNCGEEERHRILKNINSVHGIVQYIIEREADGKLASWMCRLLSLIHI